MTRALALLFIPLLAFPQDPPRDLYGDPLPRGAVARFGTLRFRHFEDVSAVAFQPDGKVLMAVDYGSINWWDVETGLPVRPAVKKEGRGFEAAFSADSRRIATGEYKKPDGWMIGIYDSATGKTVRVIKSGEDFVGQPIGVSLSADGSRIAYGGTDGQACVWDVASGEKITTLKGHSGNVLSAALSPDGKLVVTSGADKSIRFWNSKTGEESGRIDVPFPFYNLAVSKDGARLTGGSSEDHAIRVWEVAGLKEAHRIENKDEVNFNPFFSPDGSELVAVVGGLTTVHDAASGKELRRIRGGGYADLSPDGLKFAAGIGAQVRLWDAKSGAALHADRPSIGHGYGMWFSPDDATLRILGSTTQTWECATGKLRSSVEISKFHMWFGTSPDGRHYARKGSDQKVTIHSSSDDREVATLALGNNTVVSALALSNDLKRLAVGDQNPSGVHLFDLGSGAEVGTFAVDRDGSSLALSPDGELLAAEGKEGWIRVWSTVTGEVKHSLRADQFNVGTLRFSPDSRLLIAASQGKGLQVWSVDSGEALLNMASSGIMGEPFMAVSPDGRYLAGPHDYRNVKVYEAATGGEVMTIDPGRGYIHMLAISNRGHRLAILTPDGNILLWDLLAPGEDRRAAKLEVLWDDLASKDAAKAYSAMCALALKGGSVAAFLRERLIRRPPDAAALRKLLADLELEDIESRARSSEELGRLDAVVEYRKILGEKDCAAVVATTLRNLLSQVKPLRPDDMDRIRRVRAVTALDRGNSPEGTALLREVSEAVTDLRIREEAARSLERIQPKK
jgi:WD40 repeat protein